ncbi:hypothetical protein SUGI_0302870 [Cryptomeria japonica]|nr:hypothetical protein SUGI_0302870 [Cryptomeria japonica]
MVPVRSFSPTYNLTKVDRFLKEGGITPVGLFCPKLRNFNLPEYLQMCELCELRWNGRSEGIVGEIEGLKRGEIPKQRRDGAV